MDAAPDDRLSRGIAVADRLEHSGVRPDLGVAVHARLRRWYAGEVRDLDRGMAIAAVDAEAGHVVLMAERDWLHPCDSLIRKVGGADDATDDPEDESGDEHGAENGHARERIGASVEDLRHRGYRPGG